MTAKFCVNCGSGLGPADKFCAICGTNIVTNCPTCGQVWDGVIAGNEAVSMPQPKQVEATPPSEVTISESTGENKPIYGPDFDRSNDCANCGKAGNKKSCDTCGPGSNQ
jgi:hypothetical protein